MVNSNYFLVVYMVWLWWIVGDINPLIYIYIYRYDMMLDKDLYWGKPTINQVEVTMKPNPKNYIFDHISRWYFWLLYIALDGDKNKLKWSSSDNTDISDTHPFAPRTQTHHRRQMSLRKLKCDMLNCERLNLLLTEFRPWVISWLLSKNLA